MKITIFVKGHENVQIFYNENEVAINGDIFANYTASTIVYTRLKSNIGQLYREHGETVGVPNSCKYKFITDIYNHKIICYETKQVVASFDGKPTGAMASFVAYLFYLAKSKKDITKKEQTEYTAPNLQIEKETSAKEKQVTDAKQPVKEVIIIKEVPKQIEEKNEESFKQPKYEPPKYEQPKIPVPSGGNPDTGGSSMGCLWIILGALAIISAIKLIPQSWQDMPKYVAAGDTGMTICFFSSVIGAILALLVAIFKKDKVFSFSMSTFIGICITAVVINTLIQINEILEGTHKFLGAAIIDIPLSIFAAILGQFQFALPIGIGLAIICGIIHFVKNNKI